ncbi:uncharacterized protein LOC127746537 [Arachis duranensis]|uniref:Uncharacterized protein LOC127746537 n=1 Tax=Arachis duranensis TaxID=130453 RepID=A0A9C6WSZ0_ARADU|nr:uncharacterized protein LOC127746537 [Arachis duranensis]
MRRGGGKLVAPRAGRHHCRRIAARTARVTEGSSPRSAASTVHAGLEPPPTRLAVTTHTRGGERSSRGRRKEGVGVTASCVLIAGKRNPLLRRCCYRGCRGVHRVSGRRRQGSIREKLERQGDRRDEVGEPRRRRWGLTAAVPVVAGVVVGEGHRSCCLPLPRGSASCRSPLPPELPRTTAVAAAGIVNGRRRCCFRYSHSRRRSQPRRLPSHRRTLPLLLSEIWAAAIIQNLLTEPLPSRFGVSAVSFR